MATKHNVCAFKWSSNTSLKYYGQITVDTLVTVNKCETNGVNDLNLSCNTFLLLLVFVFLKCL